MAWQDELNNAYDAIKNREKFSFDPQTDAGYKQYEQAYLNVGKQAMKDTMGQAAALTGGYGNSYAQTAGQQAYNQYAGQAAQAIPTFYNMALQQYQMEGDSLRDQYSMAKDGRDFDYQQERDRVADEQWQKAFDYQQERDRVADSQWQQEFDSTYNRWLQEFDYQKSRDAVSDSQWQQEFDSTYNRWKQEFEYQKTRDAVSDSQWQQNKQYQQSRDAVSDSQWQQNFAYQQSRDAVSDSQWRETFDYQKSQDAADRAYKYAALNASKSSSKSGSANGIDFNPAKYTYNDYLKDYEQAILTNGLTDAGDMLNEWYNKRWITAQEWNDMRNHAMKNVLIPNKGKIKK